MSGFGRATGSSLDREKFGTSSGCSVVPEGRKGDARNRREVGVSVEIKSVNSKGCDISVKCSSKLAFLEEWVRSAVRKELLRGKIDVSVFVTGAIESDLEADFALMDRYDALLRRIARRYRMKRTRNLSDLLHLEGAIIHRRAEPDEELLKALVAPVLKKATDQVLAMRRTEGAILEKDIEEKLRTMEASLRTVEERRPLLVRTKYESMKAKLESLLESKVDESVLAQELAIFAERVDIEEETVRLKAHFSHMRSLFGSEEPVGRKLDFICQEMLRETNTVGSKSPDEAISCEVIALKSLIDRIKEQVQNIL